MPKPLPDDLEKVRQTYADMFGHVPPLPAGKFEFCGDVDPEYLRMVEKLRAYAFYNAVFDMKTTQLIMFAVLLAQSNPAASHHASAARRAGATWEELQAIVTLCTATGALGPSNQGGSMLNALRQSESKGG